MAIVLLFCAFSLYSMESAVLGSTDQLYQKLDQDSVEWQVCYFANETSYLIEKSSRLVLNSAKAHEVWSTLQQAQQCLTWLVGLWTSPFTREDARSILARLKFDIGAKRKEIHTNVRLLQLSREFQNIENQ